MEVGYSLLWIINTKGIEVLQCILFSADWKIPIHSAVHIVRTPKLWVFKLFAKHVEVKRCIVKRGVLNLFYLLPKETSYLFQFRNEFFRGKRTFFCNILTDVNIVKDDMSG